MKNHRNGSTGSSGTSRFPSIPESNKRHKTGSLTDGNLKRDDDTISDARQHHDAEDNVDVPLGPLTAASSSISSSPSHTIPPPKYGSKVYWDERYQTQFEMAEKLDSTSHGPMHNADSGTEKEDTTATNDEAIDDGKEKTLPYHSWYFTYEELRPIVLPLLLGSDKVGQDVIVRPDIDSAVRKIDVNSKGDDRKKEVVENNKMDADSEKFIDAEDDDGEEEEVRDGDDGGWEEVSEDGGDDEYSDADDDSTPVRDGLAKHGPVSILEIGCGDVPLGSGLAAEFRNFPSRKQNTDAVVDMEHSLSIISKIVCTDYSPVVVDMMRRQYCSTEPVRTVESIITTETLADTPKESTLQKVPALLQFEVADARKLPFSDNSFHMVLEKGTLDAVLSDTAKGITDCRQIVSECARVCSGCIVVISHLNAHTPHGLGWLEEVLMEGLKKYSVRQDSTAVSWDIEVHGNSEDSIELDDDNSNKHDSSSTNTTGPAVYVIHKTMKMQQDSALTEGIGSSLSLDTIQQQSVAMTKSTTKTTNDAIDTKSGTVAADDDSVEIVPINVRFFSY